MQESNSYRAYLAILDQREVKRARKDILLVGEKRLGPSDESVKRRLDSITDLESLERMILQAVTAASWQEIVDTPQVSVRHDDATRQMIIEDVLREGGRKWVLIIGEDVVGPSGQCRQRGPCEWQRLAHRPQELGESG